MSAAWASRRTLLSTMAGAGPPASCGQKKPSWERAAAWNVRAATPCTPSARSRPRSSPAAFAVNVTAITRHVQANVDFYVGFLGLRLIKRTGGYEDAEQLHLFYGDALGTPGSVVSTATNSPA